MRKLIEKHKKYLIFVIVTLAIGILVGIIYYQFLNQDVKSNIQLLLNNVNNLKPNNILKDLVITSMLLVSSFFIIGIPLGFFYLFYEGISFGFLLNIFYVSFNIKGILYFLLYFIVTKLLILILMIFFIKKIINISRYIIGYLIYRRDNTIKDKITINFKKCLYSILVIFIVNLIISFISPIICEKLFLLLAS